MTDPTSHRRGALEPLVLARVDTIVADWAARHDGRWSGSRDAWWKEPIAAVVSEIVRVAVEPMDGAVTDARRSLADAAARYGVAHRTAGEAAEELASECSLLFGSLWLAMTEASSADDWSSGAAERVQHALNLTLLAALIGYELGGNPHQRRALDAALGAALTECVRARPSP